MSATPASDFAETGADLLRLVAALARATQGRFDGEAATAVETASAYTEACANGFAALAVASGLAADKRSRANALAAAFREARGSMATHFPGGGTVRSLSDLGAYDPRDPNAARLAPLLDERAEPLVSVSSTAREAMETLARDPLSLAGVGADALLKEMATAADGVRVAAP